MKSKETSIKNIMVNPPYLIAFLIITAIGAFCHDFISSDWQYLSGYITACFAVPLCMYSVFEVSDEELEEILKEKDENNEN